MYIVQEIQTNDSTTSLLPAITKEGLNDAESTFHMICASAAISNVGVHTVLVYDEHGNTILRQTYEHQSI